MHPIIAQTAVVVMILSSVFTNGCSSLGLEGRSLSMLMEGTSDNDQFALARLKEKRGDYDEALRIYRKTDSADPQYRESLHRIAVVLMKQNEHHAAKSAFEEALSLGDPSGTLLNDFGYYHFLIGDDTGAEGYFRKALEKDPDFASAWANLGLVFGEQSRFEESRQAFQRVSKTPAEVHANMGYVYAGRKMYAEAQAEFLQALKDQPDFEQAVEGLLQVSAKVPGKEAITVVKTIGTPKEPRPIDESQPENIQPNGSLVSTPFVNSHQNNNNTFDPTQPAIAADKEK